MNTVAEALKAARTVREAMIAIVDVRLSLCEIMSAAVEVAENLGAAEGGDLRDTDPIISGSMDLDDAFEKMNSHLLCEHNGHCMGMPNGGGITPIGATAEATSKSVKAA